METTDGSVVDHLLLMPFGPFHVVGNSDGETLDGKDRGLLSLKLQEEEAADACRLPAGKNPLVRDVGVDDDPHAPYNDVPVDIAGQNDGRNVEGSILEAVVHWDHIHKEAVGPKIPQQVDMVVRDIHHDTEEEDRQDGLCDDDRILRHDHHTNGRVVHERQVFQLVHRDFLLPFAPVSSSLQSFSRIVEEKDSHARLHLQLVSLLHGSSYQLEAVLNIH
jgi:hypothetical protein